MTAQKNTKGSLIYLGYMVLCYIANYAAIVAQQAWRFEMNTTFEARPYYIKVFAAFLLLGLIWAAERFFANRAQKLAVLTVRILSIAVLTVLALGWFFTELITIHTFVGMGPVLAVEAGWLLYGILELLLKKDKRTNEI